MENPSELPVQKPAKVVERSAAYPAITIEDALRFVGEVHKNFKTSFTKRKDIIDLIEGAHNRHLAASSYYLLLNREKDTYQVSDFYKTLINPISPNERASSLLTAFYSPKLYKQLIEKFDSGELPKEFIAHLSRFHEITEDAAPIAADVFIKNAKYVGVLNEKNILNYKLATARADFAGVDLENELEQPAFNNAATEATGMNTQEQKEKKPLLLLNEMVNGDRIRIRLTGGRFAYLDYPLDLNTKDISILQKQIEQLQLIVESQ